MTSLFNNNLKLYSALYTDKMNGFIRSPGLFSPVIDIPQKYPAFTAEAACPG